MEGAREELDNSHRQSLDEERGGDVALPPEHLEDPENANSAQIRRWSVYEAPRYPGDNEFWVLVSSIGGFVAVLATVGAIFGAVFSFRGFEISEEPVVPFFALVTVLALAFCAGEIFNSFSPNGVAVRAIYVTYLRRPELPGSQAVGRRHAAARVTCCSMTIVSCVFCCLWASPERRPSKPTLAYLWASGSFLSSTLWLTVTETAVRHVWGHQISPSRVSMDWFPWCVPAEREYRG